MATTPFSRVNSRLSALNSAHASAKLDQETAAVHSALTRHIQEIQAIQNDRSDQGNVLAFVTFPDDDGQYELACNGLAWGDTQLRMDYDKLMSLGSKKIKDMLDPRYQVRLRRRHRNRPIPDGIQYILDFTPPVEGAELAELTAALWLPKMVKNWFLAGHYVPDSILAGGMAGFEAAPGGDRPLADVAVGATMVCGHDDVCTNRSCKYTCLSWLWLAYVVSSVFLAPIFPSKHLLIAETRCCRSGQLEDE